MDVHFSEILVILLVALLVIKPARLPEIAFKVGRLLKWGRARFYKIKNEIQNYE